MVMHRVVNRLFFLFPRRKDEFISDYKGDPTQIYAPLSNSNQTCQIYDQCAANLIDCGGGKCSNKTSPNDAPATCYCDSPLVLILLTQIKVLNKNFLFDMKCFLFEKKGPSGDSKFSITIDCTNASATIDEVCSFVFQMSFELVIF
jgi:hypothetical protein